MNPAPTQNKRRVIPYSLKDRRVGQALDIALWMTFVGTLIRGVFEHVDLPRIGGRLLVDLAAVLLILAGLQTLRRKEVRRDLGQKIYIFHLLLWMSVMAATIGLIKGNQFGNWIIKGVLPFFSSLAILMASRQVAFDRVPRTLFRQILAALPFNFYLLFIDPPPSKAYWGGINHVGRGKLFFQSLGALPFLVGYLYQLKTWQVYMLFAAWLMYLLHAMLAAYRGILLTAILMPPLALFVLWRAKQNIGRILRRTFVIFLIGVLGAFILSALFTHDLGFDVTQAWNKTVARFTHLSAEESTINELGMGAYDVSQREFMGEGGRSLERQNFFETMRPVDYVLGRGFGGTWYSSFWGREWTMVHFGPAHFILNGGVGLLLAYILAYIVALWRTWYKTPMSPVASGSFVMMLLHVISFLKHGVPKDNPKTYMLWLCMGFGFSPHYRGKLEIIRAEIRQRSRKRSRRPVVNGGPGPRAS
jgi:hypothetical protein